MKLLKISLLSLVIIMAACGEKESELDIKKSELKSLKEQFLDVKSKIDNLEKEISSLDTIVDGGVPVSIATIKLSTFSHFIEQPGIVSSKENVLVSSEMSGVVKQILAKEGSWVNKGQVILQLDASVLSSQVEELKASVELLKTTYDRQTNLWNQGIGSEIQYLQSKNQYNSMSNKLQAAQAQLDKLEITASISGRLDEVYINEGEYASPGMPILRLVNSRKLQVEANVAERYANKINNNDSVYISFNSIGIEQQEPISFIGHVINPENRTFKIKIDIKNESRFIKPNAVASLKIKDFNSDNAIKLPSKVIKKDMRGNFVFVVDGVKAVKTYIETGLSYNKYTHVLSGLKEGEKVIINGFNEVSNGSTIEIK
jgi:RND family efflux transporter MFP subunit